MDRQMIGIREKFTIDIAGFTLKNERINNEDNLVIGSQFLPADHDNAFISETAIRQAAAAVFDGIGGEAAGEVASYIAASCFAKNWTGNTTDVETHMIELSLEMNESINDYASHNGSNGMGSTMAAIMVNDNYVYGMHLGDTRIYKLTNNSFTRITQDHTLSRPGHIKGQLLSYLGRPDSDFIIPDTFRIRIREKDTYLICSDGVTDVMPEDKIWRVLNEQNQTAEAAAMLRREVVKRAPNDNSTAIVLKIRRK